MQQNGLFIVIEGTDASGKSTQYKLLKERLAKDNRDVVEIHFPRYEEPSSYFVREYLAGRYGSANEVGPYVSSIFYALDRFQAAKTIKEALAENKIVLCDRFVGSNMAHQGTKFSNDSERRGYFIWLDNLEFELLGIPRPTYNFVLTAPFEIIRERINQRTDSSTHVSGKDIHEVDESHIAKSLAVYNDLCDLFPKDFRRIESVRGNQLLSPEQINTLIWTTIEPVLPERNEMATKKTPVKPADNPYLRKTDTGYQVLPAGTDFLKECLTDVEGDVYAFSSKLSPTTIAAAMARLSRRGDDMRVTILDEFAASLGKDEKLLQRVITAYGDDSVQQLVGLHFVVENASNLLTKKLEWGRLAAYLEQSTRYIYYDQKSPDGTYKYYTPPQLNTASMRLYTQTMDRIFASYSDIVHKLTDYVRANSTTPKEEQDIAWQGATRAQACDAARPLLPVAVTSTVGIYASGQALESLIMHLLSDEIPESVKTGESLLKNARAILPTFLERADKPDRGGAMIAYRANTHKAVAQLAQEYLPSNHADNNHEVTLTSVWPRNELDLVPDMLYEHSNMPLQELQELVSSWPITRKQDVFNAYMGERLNRRHRPGRALEKAHYSWDLMCDYGIFRDLQRHRMVDDLEWQSLTPRYGYEIPSLVEEAGLSDTFEQCFELSLMLYSKLVEAGYQLEAQYATLLGHKMRWKVTYNAREAFHLHELRTSPQGHPGYRKLVLQMHERLAEVHPMLAEAMRFVNSDEDPELTRLAAERYTQFKLQQMG